MSIRKPTPLKRIKASTTLPRVPSKKRKYSIIVAPPPFIKEQSDFEINDIETSGVEIIFSSDEDEEDDDDDFDNINFDNSFSDDDTSDIEIPMLNISQTSVYDNPDINDMNKHQDSFREWEGFNKKENRKENPINELVKSLKSLSEQELITIFENIKEDKRNDIISLFQLEINNINTSKVLNDDKDDKWDWNTRFQTSLLKLEDISTEIMDNNNLLHAWSYLSKTANDFVHIATVYGKIIISEVYTSISEKTIKPVSMGGTIGGDKYLVKKILFKFPKEDTGFYDATAAAKIAGHELKGLSHLFNCNVSGLHYPMLAIIDYLGFRLIAMTQLPLTKDSLLYGSNDAGKTIQMDNNFYNLLEICSKKLNIKSHYVGQRNNLVKVCSPADLEGHLGLDSKFYVLDFSRVFPPEPPRKDIKGSHLFRLLRPELVKSNPVPLCSDAFTGFIINSENPEEHNKEIIEASSRLFKHIIPSVGEELNQLSKNALHKYLGASNLLVEIIHASGINIRFLGILRKYIRNKLLRAQIMIEILSRTIKTLLRSELREAMKISTLPLEHSYKRSVLHIINIIFGNKGNYWHTVLLPTAKTKFEECFSKNEENISYNMRSYIKDNLGLGCFFLRLIQITGLVFNSQTIDDFTKKEELFNCREPFGITDLEELAPQVHHMNIVDNAIGTVLKCRAQFSKDANKERLCKTAIRHFDRALYDNPKQSFALRNYAGILAMLGYYRQASDYYKLALQVDDNDLLTLYDYSCFLLEVGSYNKAYDYFEKIITQEPVNLQSLYKGFEAKLSKFDNGDLVIDTIRTKLERYFPPTKRKTKSRSHTRPIHKSQKRLKLMSKISKAHKLRLSTTS